MVLCIAKKQSSVSADFLLIRGVRVGEAVKMDDFARNFKSGEWFGSLGFNKKDNSKYVYFS